MLNTPLADQQCSSSPMSGRWGSVDSVVLPVPLWAGRVAGVRVRAWWLRGVVWMQWPWRHACRVVGSPGSACHSMVQAGAAGQGWLATSCQVPHTGSLLSGATPAALRARRCMDHTWHSMSAAAARAAHQTRQQGGQSGALTRKAEEEGHVALHAHVAARVQRQHAALGHEVVHEAEDALLHLAGVLRAQDDLAGGGGGVSCWCMMMVCR